MPLFLGLKVGESVLVTHQGETMRLFVAMAEGNQVAVGFDAPRTFHILRQEVATEEAQLEREARRRG